MAQNQDTHWREIRLGHRLKYVYCQGHFCTSRCHISPASTANRLKNRRSMGSVPIPIQVSKSAELGIAGIPHFRIVGTQVGRVNLAGERRQLANLAALLHWHNSSDRTIATNNDYGCSRLLYVCKQSRYHSWCISYIKRIRHAIASLRQVLYHNLQHEGGCSLNLNRSDYSPGLGIVRRPKRRKASFFCSQTSSDVSFSSSRRVRS